MEIYLKSGFTLYPVTLYPDSTVLRLRARPLVYLLAGEERDVKTYVPPLSIRQHINTSLSFL